MNQLLFVSIILTVFDIFLIIYAFTLPLYPTSWRKKVNKKHNNDTATGINKKHNNDTATGITILFVTLACCVSWIIYFYFLIFHL